MRKKPSPVILGAGVVILLLAAYAYFAPRVVSETQVRRLCIAEANRQTEQAGDMLVDAFRQEGYRAEFTLLAAGGRIKIPVTCVVGGDARAPQVRVTVRR